MMYIDTYLLQWLLHPLLLCSSRKELYSALPSTVSSPRCRSEQQGCGRGTGSKGAHQEPLGTKHPRRLVPGQEHHGLAQRRSRAGGVGLGQEKGMHHPAP